MAQTNDFASNNTSGATKVFKYKDKLGPFHNLVVRRNDFGSKYLYDTCSVDIIIPYHCKYDLVRRAVKSILEYTKSNPYLITLVDDGSQGEAADEFSTLIKQAPNVQYLRLEQQQGFGAAVEFGLKNTKNPYVCVMHSDVEVVSLDWLESMGETLVTKKKENIRLVVARTNNPGEGKTDLLKGEGGDDIISNEPLPLHCALCHRGLFDRIGPIKAYPYCWYEDEELFYRMKYHGYKQAISGRSWVKHEGSATANYILQKEPGAIEIMRLNRSKCLSDLKKLYGR